MYVLITPVVFHHRSDRARESSVAQIDLRNRSSQECDLVLVHSRLSYTTQLLTLISAS